MNKPNRWREWVPNLAVGCLVVAMICYVGGYFLQTESFSWRSMRARVFNSPGHAAMWRPVAWIERKVVGTNIGVRQGNGEIMFAEITYEDSGLTFVVKADGILLNTRTRVVHWKRGTGTITKVP